VSKHAHRILIAGVAVAAAAVTRSLVLTISAQSLTAPTFTTAQQIAGDAIYKERCESCHGKNLDDGEFGPPLKGVEFRSAWFGRTADVLFAKIETMPPAAPGSLAAEKHASLLAYLMSQNQLAASTKALPGEIDQLKAMLLPGATGGPSGGLSPFAVLPPQNATGNWVKVVQRVPIRLAVQMPADAPDLRTGMSATVEIDTGHRRALGDLVDSARQFVGM
jgi:mono/diheme cytochrome c family protein